MGSLLEAIFTLSVGGLFLIAIMTSLVNLQASAQDTSFQATLNSVAEVQYREIYDHLGKVGVLIEDQPILAAEPDNFVFQTKWDIVGDSLSSDTNRVSISLGDSTDTGYPVVTKQNGNPLPGSDAPMWLKDMTFTYFDINENRIVTPDDSLDFIRSVRVDLEFFWQGSYTGPGERRVGTFLTFWKYFTNLYL